MEIVDLSDHLRIPVNHQSEDTLMRPEISITESDTQKIVIERWDCWDSLHPSSKPFSTGKGDNFSIVFTIIFKSLIQIAFSYRSDYER